jgi:uncharacterized radical SAM superfamily Fe-S cluster-containing enzyme
MTEKPTQCEYCGKKRDDLVPATIWRNGEKVMIMVCPEKGLKDLFNPDCAIFAQMGAEG